MVDGEIVERAEGRDIGRGVEAVGLDDMGEEVEEGGFPREVFLAEQEAVGGKDVDRWEVRRVAKSQGFCRGLARGRNRRRDGVEGRNRVGR